jgi:DNA-binding HxlR family transcriptional regulator
VTHRSYRQDGCGIAAALEVVGDRWTLLIVRELMKGNRRFTELQAALPGLAPNLLSGRLKQLCEAGVAERIAYREIPPRVEYLLTPGGLELRPVLQALLEWGTRHRVMTGTASLPGETPDPRWPSASAHDAQSMGDAGRQ